jgi:class 3 adenylate cyclase/tetratricopeptide (TPR) repeat protein
MTCPNCGRETPEGFPRCANCGAELVAALPAREQRKTVTVLFCDVTGSTALGESTDPEALRALLARYFERMSEIVEAHGGTVEKFIGDAVMAVFGVPVVHEDDALRAARAALEMRDALPELGVSARIGINTGEVVTGTEERLATGDAVNVAARLEQAAQPNEILIGEDTLRLVRDAVETEPVQPLELKGKAEPVSAYRLLAVHEEPERPQEARFVGRGLELESLREAWRRAHSERACRLVTIVGEPGVGKSRLTAEFLREPDATVVRGRCLSYGEGITYWPVVEVLKQLQALPSEPGAAASLRSLLGESDEPTSADDIAWAFRKLLEEQAPLICLFDDIQWGEDMFLDLVEGMALLSTGAPILLICLTRPDLVERRPSWPVALRLEPLPEGEVLALVGDLPAALREKIAHTSGGNPLFVTEIAAMARESGAEVAVPPTLRALLAARLDQLEEGERSVLEWGAVEGEIFHRGAVQALSDNRQVTSRLAGLVRKQLIRPERPVLAGDDAFRFGHLLIRDAAYDALPKAARAELHERFARWLTARASGLVELDEVVGYHLEQACRCRIALGTPVESTLADEARRHLAAGGYRALRRQDYRAALNLLERVSGLVPAGEFDLILEVELRNVLFWLGKSDEAMRRARELEQQAAAAGDEIAELCARILVGVGDTILEPERGRDRLRALIEEALPVFRRAGNDIALYVAFDAMAEAAVTNAAALEAVEQAAAHAQRVGHEPDYLGWRAASRFFGTTPVTDVLAWLDENEPGGGREYFLAAYRAGSLALLGRFDEARSLLAEMRAELGARGPSVLLANITSFESVWVELLAGNPAAAAEFGLEGWRLYSDLGEQRFLVAAAGDLAQAFYALDRLDEAEAWAARAEARARVAEGWDEMRWRQVKAKVLARRGVDDAAERLAREAVRIGDETDQLSAQGDAYLDLAEVLALVGKPDEAASALGEALDRYERKENLVMAERVRERLAGARAEAKA